MGAPPLFRSARNSAYASTDSIPDSQLKESLTILYGLVFELRQGMEDLQFRLQIMDGKISTLLQILSTFQDAFPSTPEGAASAEEPHAESDDRNAQPQRSAEVVVEQVKHEDTEAATATGQHVYSPPKMPCQLPTRTRATWTLTCIWKAKGHPLKRSLGTRPF
jgi:hypothetical protein